MLKTILESISMVHVPPDGTAATTYALAAGTTDVNSGAVNATGYSRVCFLWIFGDNADTGTFTGSIEKSADGSTGFAAVTNATSTFTAGASDTDTEMLAIECDVDPAYPYYRAVSNRGTANTVIAALMCFLGRRAGYSPITQTVGAGQFIQTPVNVIA